MQHNIRWLTNEEIPLIKELSATVYKTAGDTYSPNLGPHSRLFDMFLLPSSIIGAEHRKVVGVFDSDGTLMMAIGARRIYNSPSWLLSWMVSGYKTARFAILFKQALTFMCEYFEGIGHNEFYVVHPAEREEVYRYVIKFMRERYWTFVEMTIPKHIKPDYSFYWALMGYQLYQYDICIRRYILKRPQDD